MFCQFKNLPGWGEITPSGASQFLETVKGSAWSMPLICKLAKSRDKPLLSGPFTPKQYFPALDHSRAWYKATRDHPYNPKPSLQKLFKLANLQLFTLP